MYIYTHIYMPLHNCSADHLFIIQRWHIHIYTYITYVNICIYTHTYIYALAQLLSRSPPHHTAMAYTYLYIYNICKYMYIYTHIYMSLHNCSADHLLIIQRWHIYIYIYISVYTHTHTHIHKPTYINIGIYTHKHPLAQLLRRPSPHRTATACARRLRKRRPGPPCGAQ